MAINPNHDAPNRHIAVVAMTGGGKSQAMRNEIIPRKGIRALFWDVDQDHFCTRYSDRKEFMRAVNAKLKAGAKEFRIGWDGDDDLETFMWFCACAWEALDGRHDTWIVIEEAADLQLGEKMPPFLQKLNKRGRKYGAIVVTTTQRCQEVPKALITQPAVKWIGQHEANDAEYLKRMTRLNPEEIEALAPLNFFRKQGPKWERVRVPYRKYSPR